ncbi:hypothetical protein [Kitasatospora sp. A2-31]|uniref:hypothetical protein n=1 Tax=Kitasatospora sp. A2-31 TaxID=2916414 RepID=UPI001EECEC2D|nr:hypothetical protein [Kitasatospora sp. A2-31]MCG6494903.1 hypothetical protein [Kitasatospora sp. A2-31]
MTSLATRGDAASVLLMLLAEHGDITQPDQFEVCEYESETGEPDWGVCLIVRDSLGRFEQWRHALDLDPSWIDYSSCPHGACLRAGGEYENVPVELFAVADFPGQ